MAKRDLSMFGLFVSPTGKGKATRYGSPLQMGAKRDPKTGEVTIKTKMVVAIPHTELLKCGRGYRRQIAEGALKERTAEDFLAYARGEEKAAAAARKDAEAKAKKAAAAPTATTSPSVTTPSRNEPNDKERSHG